MIDIEKLKKYVEENFVDEDATEEKRENMFSLTSNPLLDFARKISGRESSMFSGMSPLKHPDFHKVKDELEHNQEDFSRQLVYYANRTGKTHPQIYKAAGITPHCFSKLQSGTSSKPKRENAFALAFALELNMEEAKEFLAAAGYAFPIITAKEDIIYSFCFEHGPYTVDEVNEALCHFGFKAIGGRN